MDFNLTEDQKMFQSMVRDFATKEIEPVAAACDEAAEFPADNARKMAELGLLGVSFPEEYGGSGGTSIHYVILVEEISRACAGHGIIVSAHISLAAYPIYRFGTEEQKQRYLVPLASGEKLGAFALSEPGAGSDAGSLETAAVRQGDSYILNGTKNFVTNGAEAGIAIVFATVDKSLGHRGITSFIVEKGSPGFSVGKHERKLGIRASSTTEFAFEDCRVSQDCQLGDVGRGLRIALDTLDTGRVGVAAQAVGIAQACLEASVRYAKERQQFGQAIAQFQAIQWMLVDMATSIDAARLLTQRAAFVKDQGLPFAKEAAMAKVFASEAAMAVSTKAIQIHGGYGYVKEYPIERYFRDAKITEIYEGTSEMQRMAIGRSLLA